MYGHFNAIRGTNAFAGCDAVAVVGRPLPSHENDGLAGDALSRSAGDASSTRSGYLKAPVPVHRAIGGAQLAYQLRHTDKWPERWRGHCSDDEVRQALARMRYVNLSEEHAQRTLMALGATNHGLPVDCFLRSVDLLDLTELHVMAALGVVVTNAKLLLRSRYTYLFGGLRERGVKERIAKAKEVGVDLNSLPTSSHMLSTLLKPDLGSSEGLHKVRKTLGETNKGSRTFFDLADLKPQDWGLYGFRLDAGGGRMNQALINETMHPSPRLALATVLEVKPETIAKFVRKRDVPVRLCSAQTTVLELCRHGVRPSFGSAMARARGLEALGLEALDFERELIEAAQTANERKERCAAVPTENRQQS